VFNVFELTKRTDYFVVIFLITFKASIDHSFEAAAKIR
jgi:hypothetical protein